MFTGTSLAPQEFKSCELCRYFGGWPGYQRHDGTWDYDLYGVCLNPKLSRGIAEPNKGCVFWAELLEAARLDDYLSEPQMQKSPPDRT